MSELIDMKTELGHCILCGSSIDNDSDHVRTAWLDRGGSMDNNYYKPRLTVDELYAIRQKIGHGEFEICSNRVKCRERSKK